MTSKGFLTRWRKQRRVVRNATGGRITAERRKLVKMVADELRQECATKQPQLI